MKAVSILALGVLIAAPAFSQQQAAGGSAAGKQSLQFEVPETHVRVEDLQITQTDKVKLKKHFSLSGPLVHAFKVTKVSEVPKRLLHLINPFSKSTAADDGEAPQQIDGLDTRSWTTRVGWQPGASPFANGTTQEPCEPVGLFSAGW